MPQPKHLRAPATPAPHAVAACTPASPLLDDWSSLSPIALPTLATHADSESTSLWSYLVSILIPRLQSARAA